MNSSWHAFPFSFLPPQALRAEACRARPYEKVRAQGLCRGHWFMAFRLTEASSSLWPPDKNVMPVQVQEERESLARHFSRHLSEWHADYCVLKLCKCVHVNKSILCASSSPGTAGGTVRRRAVTVAMAISWLLYLCELECPGVTMLGLSRVPSR